MKNPVLRRITALLSRMNTRERREWKRGFVHLIRRTGSREALERSERTMSVLRRTNQGDENWRSLSSGVYRGLFGRAELRSRGEWVRHACGAYLPPNQDCECKKCMADNCLICAPFK